MEESGQNMFWGLIVKPDKRFEQTVESAFHVSKACVDPSTSSGVTTIFVEVDGGDEFIVANLSHPQLNENLDLTFGEGDKITFRSSGAATVHLTGYLIPEDDQMMPPFMEGEESESEEEEDAPVLVNGAGKLSKAEKMEAIKKAIKAQKKIKAEAQKKGEDDDEDDSDEYEDMDDEEGSDDDDDEDEDESDDDDEEEEEEQKPTPSKKEEKQKKKDANGSAPATPQAKKDNKDSSAAKIPAKRQLKGGIVSEDVRLGKGPVAQRGKNVGMYYEGRLKSNNKKFDSCLKGKPFKFRLGAGEVIKGWDIGVEGMKVGGKRKLVIPAGMAYGSRGAPPDIPPNATLVFDVECKNVN